MDSLIDRINRSVAQRGYFGTLQLCVVSVCWMVLPRFRRKELSRQKADAEFDAKFGVNTGGVFRPRSEDVIGENWAYGGSYQAVDPSSFLQVIGELAIPFEKFSFVDLGSGKGRTLLLASLFPFRRIIGVEYCRELNKVARQNLQRFNPPERKCREIEIVESDAAEFTMPRDPLVLFLFHPFAEQVMTRVVNNVIQSYRSDPRRIVVVYFIPNHGTLWETTGIFQRVAATPAVFDSEPAPVRGQSLVAAVQAFYFLVLNACSDPSLQVTS